MAAKRSSPRGQAQVFDQALSTRMGFLFNASKLYASPHLILEGSGLYLLRRVVTKWHNLSRVWRIVVDPPRTIFSKENQGAGRIKVNLNSLREKGYMKIQPAYLRPIGSISL